MVRLLLLEYRAEDPNIPIKPLHKMSVAQVNKEMAANGFKLSLTMENFFLFNIFYCIKKVLPEYFPVYTDAISKS